MKRVLGRSLDFGRAHWLFLLLLAAGAALRAVTMLAYRPALLGPDSDWYLERAANLGPAGVRPIGYAVFLRVLPIEHGLMIVPLVQHVFGLAIAVVVYALLLRLGVRRWLAALAAGPVLLDAYQLNMEQQILSETLFLTLLVGASALLLWRRPLGLTSAALAGLLLALAALTRGIAVLVFVPMILTVVFLRARPSRAAALLTLFAVPVVAYATWFHAAHGQFALSSFEGRFLYGRVVGFADCKEFAVPEPEEVLCPDRVVRRLTVPQLLWSKRRSPIYRINTPSGKTRNEVAGDFAKRAIRHQPLGYARSIGSDFLFAFGPTKEARPGEFGVEQWRFQLTYPVPRLGSLCPPPSRAPSGSCQGKRRMTYEIFKSHGNDLAHVERGLASFLRGYQRFGYTPGPILAAGLLAGIAAALGLGRARRSGLRSAAFLFSATALVISLGSVALTVFSWRYQLPLLVLLPPVLAVAVTAFTGSETPDPASTNESEARPDTRVT